jgi:hypothetical protein
MKQITLLLSIIIICLANSFAQQRYIDEVFDSVQVTSNVTYGENISFFPPNVGRHMQSLLMDVYEPVTDTLDARPLIVFMHPGDFLPLLWNGNPTGDLHDSGVVEICKQFARRGYVVANIDYRVGWNPLNLNQDCRTAQLLQAVYRGLHDAKTCVRFFRMDVATQGNTFGIDENRIVVGGQGSSGYIATSYATLNKPGELQLLKFISSSTDPSCGCMTGVPYIIPDVLGDFDGLGGDTTYNHPNWPGYSSNVNMVFNLEGALGDSSWLEAGEVPMVSFHDVNNPLTPYMSGGVFLPPPFNYFIIDVTGSHDFIRRANQLGNNDVFHLFNWGDPYTTRANEVNEGWEGLFPIVQPDPSVNNPYNPFHGQINPWEWWSCTDLEIIAPYLGKTVGYADTICGYGYLTNPDMSKLKALAYIDTVQGYLDPRICRVLELCKSVGIEEVKTLKAELNLFPNPSSQILNIQLKDATAKILSVKIFDVAGRKVFDDENLNQNHAEISCRQFTKGLFTVRVQTDLGVLTEKLVIE